MTKIKNKLNHNQEIIEKSKEDDKEQEEPKKEEPKEEEDTLNWREEMKNA